MPNYSRDIYLTLLLKTSTKESMNPKSKAMFCSMMNNE
jgi:hypothetical protein